MKKIAIIGKLQGKIYAPYNDNSWDIWGCNYHNDMHLVKRFDLWFDIHNKNFTHKLLEIIPEEKLITRDKYPFEKVFNLLGGNYLNNSMAYMIAYAILQNPSHISIYGCNFFNDEEIRTQQKQNTRELLFFAKGRGIKVYSQEGSLLQGYQLYGEN